MQSKKPKECICDLWGLLQLIKILDPHREGLPETEVTCDDQGKPLHAQKILLEKLFQLGYVKQKHPWIDITDEGLHALKYCNKN